MPIYEYRCKKCGKIFEEFQNIKQVNENLKCPFCGEMNPERIFSVFSSSGTSQGSSSYSSCSPAGFS